MENQLDKRCKRKAKVVKVEKIVEAAVRLEIRLDDGAMEFLPGQYVWVRTGQGVKAFSIVERLEDGRLFSVIIYDSGSDFKQSLARVGQTVEIDGPQGSFVLDNNDSQPVILVAGGVGITPFIPMLRKQSENNFVRNIILIYANNSLDREIFGHEFEEMAQKQTTFRFYRKIGQLEENDLKIDGNIMNSRWYISGAQEMVTEVSRILDKIGVAKENRKYNQFYPEVERKSLQDKDEFELAVKNSGEHHIITDENGIIVYANKAASQITGFSQEEMRGQTPRLWGGLMTSEYYLDFWNNIKSERKYFEGEVINRRKNGEEYIAYVRISPIVNNDQLLGFVGTEVDITKLKEVDRMKTEFISLASHQLRTPLSTARWSIESLLDGNLGELSDKQKEILQILDKSNLQMTDLVNGLLDVSRIESGKLVIEPKLINLGDVAKEVIMGLTAKLLEKSQSVEVSLGDDLPQVMADPKLISQVYMNYLTNAIKYAPPGSAIELSIYQRENEVFSKVIDTGMGVPKADQPRIFERFYRGENAIKQVVEGTGLGLYLVKLIIEASHGKVWFESEEGKGSKFYFSLPI